MRGEPPPPLGPVTGVRGEATGDQSPSGSVLCRRSSAVGDLKANGSAAGDDLGATGGCDLEAKPSFSVDDLEANPSLSLCGVFGRTSLWERLGFKAHRLVYHSNLGWRAIKKKRLGIRVQGLGMRAQ